MLVNINKNWYVNILKIKDIGLDNDDKKKIHVTWLDGTTDSYNCESETGARAGIERIVAKVNDFWNGNTGSISSLLED